MSTKNNLAQQKLFKYSSTRYKVLLYKQKYIKISGKNRKPDGKIGGRNQREKLARNSIIYELYIW